MSGCRHTQSTAFHPPIFRKLKNAEQHYVQIVCTELTSKSGNRKYEQKFIYAST